MARAKNRRAVVDGPFEGYWVCTARKAGRCDFRYGRANHQCPETIEVGNQYVRGDNDPYRAGGFATQRWCLKHFPNIGIQRTPAVDPGPITEYLNTGTVSDD